MIILLIVYTKLYTWGNLKMRNHRFWNSQTLNYLIPCINLLAGPSGIVQIGDKQFGSNLAISMISSNLYSISQLGYIIEIFDAQSKMLQD